MNRADKIIILLLHLFCSLPAIDSNAQQGKKEVGFDQYRAAFWGTKDGLPFGIMNVMIKDVKGFLWIGTASLAGELCRFDGSEFKKYSTGSRKTGDINSQIVFSLKEDSMHNIWMGTDKGLSRYDMKTDTFSYYTGGLDSPGLMPKCIPFWTTKNEIYCIESETWITTYNAYSLEKKRRFKIPPASGAGFGTSSLYAIYDEKSNSVWMLKATGDGLFQLSLSTGRMVLHQRTVFFGDKGKGDAEGMCFDKKRNCIWLNCYDGLTQFTLRDQRFQHVDALNDFVNLKDYTRFVGIEMDKQGRIWVSTHPKGILIYDPDRQMVRPLFTDPTLVHNTGEGNLHIYCDRDGIMWSSYWGATQGIYAFLPFNKLVMQFWPKPGQKDSLSNGSISTIQIGPGGKLWIGTANGLNIFDPETEKFELLQAKDLPGIKGTAIIPLYVDTVQQKAWLNAGTQDAFKKYFQMDMYEMNLKTRECRRIVFMDKSKRIDSFIVAHTLIRPYKKGILFCDELHGLFEIKEGSLSADLILPGISGGAGVGDFVYVEDRYLFFQGGGDLPNTSFEKKNEVWAKMSHFLDSLNWSCMDYDRDDQTYWVGFNNEWVHYNKDFRKMKSYAQEDVLFGLATSMIKDDEGNRWFTNMAKQIGRLNPITGVITMMSENDGYKTQDFGWFIPKAKDMQGNLYFGIGWNWSLGNGALSRVSPQRYASANNSIVYFKTLTVNQELIPLSTRVNSLEELSLPYDQNDMRIEAGIIDFYSKEKGQVRYKLEKNGFGDDWKYSKDRIIRYEGLSPGNYRLVVQASKASNGFNGPEKILMIKIGSPFWETWWFRSLALISIVLIVYGFFQYRSRNLRRRNVELEEKVLSRTMELKHSLEELRDTQTQLIQREKMASLGELTAGIAHEIQNPLNFVNNFSEVSAELVGEMKAEMKTGNSDEALNIADDIEANLQKIVRHGKRADAIVRGMLEHSRSSSGEKLPTDINALTDEYIRLSYHGMKAKDKSFTSTIHTDFDEKLSASKPDGEKVVLVPQEIGRVLMNLFNNAFYSVNEKKRNPSGLMGKTKSIRVNMYQRLASQQSA